MRIAKYKQLYADFPGYKFTLEYVFKTKKEAMAWEHRRPLDPVVRLIIYAQVLTK